MKQSKPQERIQKIISNAGFCSRRKAEEYIQSGSVKVNGRVIKIGDTASTDDTITVNGEKLNTRNKILRYIKLYKPRGYITTLVDTHERKTVADLIKDIPERIYPVGRLDKNSEGLLLLTNDGDFANLLTHPSKKVKKVYRVTIPAAVDDKTLSALMQGMDIGEDGETEFTQPCEVKVISAKNEADFEQNKPAKTAKTEKPAKTNEPRTILEFTITEGKKRQIRRMCDKAGLPVSRLRRISIGGVKLGMLKPSNYTDLTNEELALLLEKNRGREKNSK
jgi:23S rRNA pseudouridine2605 synthase